MRAAVDADADHADELNPRKHRTFEEHAGELGAVVHDIVRPFELEPGITVEASTEHFRQGHAGDEAKLRCQIYRRGIAQGEAHVEIPRRRGPHPPLPPTTTALLPRGDDEIAGLASTQPCHGLVVCGGNPAESDMAIGSRHSRSDEAATWT